MMGDQCALSRETLQFSILNFLVETLSNDTLADRKLI